MTKSKTDGDTNEDRGRPEDPDTPRLKRGARLLRGDMLPAVAALVGEAEDRRDVPTLPASITVLLGRQRTR
jgi:hypothetical protein